MRDVNRIPKIIDLIQRIWIKQPDTRFNQLMHNLQYEYSLKAKYPLKELHEKEELLEYDIVAYRSVKVVDLFNLEDDCFIAFLENKVKEIENNNENDK